MVKRSIILESFKFTDGDPSFTPRTPYYTMSEDELSSIEKYPFILDERCPFRALFKVDGKPLELKGVVPKGFTYNLADIPWFVEPITYDKHSPFVKDASFIHDYLLSHKRMLYQDWELKDKGISPNDFKEMTSLIFCYQLKVNGVLHDKAQLMTFFVNLFQSFLPSWHKIDVMETSL